MTKLTSLPPELLLLIISHLPLPSIAAIASTCRELHNVCTGDYQNGIYRGAAATHGLAPLGSDDDDCFAKDMAQWFEDRYGPQWETSSEVDWKSICRSRAEIARAWAGDAPSRIVRYHPRADRHELNLWTMDTPRQVHRIKVDELRGFFLSTSRSGGLAVSDIRTGKTLWNLPQIYVRPYAHLEYENGYVVFDRGDGRKEVWRHSSIPETPIEENLEPDPVQRQVAHIMETFHAPPEDQHPKVRFVPHMLIPVPMIPPPAADDDLFNADPPTTPVPDPTRAYRLVFPHLLAASSTRAYITDIRTGKRVQVIENVGRIRDLGSAAAVEEEEEEAQETPRTTSSEAPFPATRMFSSGLFDDCAPLSAPHRQQLLHHQPPNPQEVHPLASHSDLPAATGLGGIRYVELGERWVVIVGERELRLFARGAEWTLGLRLPASRVRHGRWRARLGPRSVRAHPKSELVRQEVVWDLNEDAGTEAVLDGFMAAHLSPDQNHLAVLTKGSRLIYIPFFERVVKGECSVYDVAYDITLGSPRVRSVYLAYGGRGNARIGVVTEAGVFVVTPYHSQTSSGKDVEFTVHRVTPFFLDPDRLSFISCLMMSETGLWLNWERMEVDNAAEGNADDDDDDNGGDSSPQLFDPEEERRYEVQLREEARWYGKWAAMRRAARDAGLLKRKARDSEDGEGQGWGVEEDMYPLRDRRHWDSESEWGSEDDWETASEDGTDGMDVEDDGGRDAGLRREGAGSQDVHSQDHPQQRWNSVSKAVAPALENTGIDVEPPTYPPWKYAYPFRRPPQAFSSEDRHPTSSTLHTAKEGTRETRLPAERAVSSREKVHCLFEWMFVRGLNDEPVIKERGGMSVMQQVNTDEVADESPFAGCSEVHQVSFGTLY